MKTTPSDYCPPLKQKKTSSQSYSINNSADHHRPHHHPRHYHQFGIKCTILIIVSMIITLSLSSPVVNCVQHHNKQQGAHHRHLSSSSLSSLSSSSSSSPSSPSAHLNSLTGVDSGLVWNPKSTLCDRSGPSPLGMESGSLSDSILTASSSYNEQSVGPQFARLNQDKSGGAWCPAKQMDIENAGSEWIQVNLTNRYVITGLATQGRFGNGLGVEYVEEYWIEYSRDGGVTWRKWKNRKGSHILKGNMDTYSEVMNHLEVPIVGADTIRIFPFSQHFRTVCLRFELFGCPYKDGPISYSMPDGFFGGRFGDLLDSTYDGTRVKSYLTGGMGQLTDGILGHENIKINAGFEWISWKAQNETIELFFEFPQLLNFTSAVFHCHNMFHKSMEVFSSAKVYFSFDGERWSKSPLDFEYMPDHIMDIPREVNIHLNHKIARFVRFSLKFGAKWLLISEVKFISRPVVGNYNENIDDLESLEVAQEVLEPISVHNKESSSANLVIVCISLGSLALIIAVALSFLAYKAWQKRRKITNFYPVDIDYLGGSGLSGVVSSNGGKITTPVYCEPGELGSDWANPIIPPNHEYAIPDLTYQHHHNNRLHHLNTHHHPHTNNQNNGSSNNSSVTQHLISNPMQTLDDHYEQHLQETLEQKTVDKIANEKNNLGISLDYERKRSGRKRKKRVRNVGNNLTGQSGCGGGGRNNEEDGQEQQQQRLFCSLCRSSYCRHLGTSPPPLDNNVQQPRRQYLISSLRLMDAATLCQNQQQQQHSPQHSHPDEGEPEDEMYSDGDENHSGSQSSQSRIKTRLYVPKDTSTYN